MICVIPETGPRKCRAKILVVTECGNPIPPSLRRRREWCSERCASRMHYVARKGRQVDWVLA